MIRRAEKGDAEKAAGLAVLLWGDHSIEDLKKEFAELLSDDEACIVLAYEKEIPVGFGN